MSELAASHSQLAQVAKRLVAADPKYPLSISQIPTFPYRTFSDMVAATRCHEFKVARFSFQQDADVLRLLCPQHATIHSISVGATFLIPLVSIGLAFTVSHWFWLGLLYFFVGSRITTRIWTSGILEAAMSSESAFCFLFYASKINCYDVKSRKEYEWQLLQRSAQLGDEATN